MAHQGFGMAVLVYDPYIDEAKCPDYVTVLRDRDELFRRADFISIHLPVTAETRYSVGAREFQLMKREAFLINTARGPIVDTEALVAALKSGGIAGAALDATEPEPTEPDSPLFGMDNVILTPHVAGSTVEAKAKSSLGAAMGCDEILTGKPPSHLIV